MLRLVGSASALLLGVGLLVCGAGLLGTLLALRGDLAGFDAGTLGWIMSGYFFGFVLGTYLSMPLIRRLGHIRSFAFCAAAAAAAVLLHPILIDPWAWGLLRIITGVAFVCLYAVIESWLGAQASMQERGRLFAAYMVVNLVAIGIGQLLLPLAPIDSFVPFSLVALLTCLALMPVTWTRVAQPEITGAAPLPLAQLWRDAPSAAAGAFVSGIVMGAFWGLMPLFASGIGLDSGGVAYWMITAIAAGALLQWPLGRWSDRADRRRVLAAVALLGALSAGLLGLLQDVGELRFGLLFVYGGFVFSLYPISVAHLMDRLEAETLLAGSGRVLLLYGAGATLGPILAGASMKALGPASLMYFSAAALLLLSAFIARRLQLRDSRVVHPGHFMPMVRTSPTAMEMLPEAQPEAAE
ncbi:MFS transporter [Pseudomarimonas arenosa]|uniref:MFS transporter n=1 Tax=Pseudomarimonas arenosa TaxID=2774145 RepID=A0AAW3ZL83_9GAMM|nr:MFS transporter [Pseudomarimonas arenosa]MBD8526801.1 MFS transporter [Pseudomarimonas arenosa]